MTTDEKIDALTQTVSEMQTQMNKIIEAIDSRMQSDDNEKSITVDGQSMSLAEYETYIRKLELDNRLREAKRLEKLAELAERYENG